MTSTGYADIGSQQCSQGLEVPCPLHDSWANAKSCQDISRLYKDYNLFKQNVQYVTWYFVSRTKLPVVATASAILVLNNCKLTTAPVWHAGRQLETFPNKGLNRSLKQLQVYCTHRKDGCQWKREPGELDQHLKMYKECPLAEPEVCKKKEGRQQGEDRTRQYYGEFMGTNSTAGKNVVLLGN